MFTMHRHENLNILSDYCSEFLVHGVDVEGKRAGIEEDLVRLLGDFAETRHIPITYAGGVRSMQDLELVRELGKDKVDCTVGSALDCFGGDMSYSEVLQWHKAMNEHS
jgi:phosphoribosylformimino-5-aminoimidazole carboxamide ribotide isomerase